LVASHEEFRTRSALEFTRRQVTIARIYNPSSWWSGLVSHSLFLLGFFGGGARAIHGVVMAGGVQGLMEFARRDTGPSLFTRAHGDSPFMALAAGSILLIYVLGSLKSWLRLRAVTHVLPEVGSTKWRVRIVYYLLWPLVSVLFLYDFISSATTRRIKWRGVWYEMRSPTDTVVLGDSRE
jgi:hypothetical protein